MENKCLWPPYPVEKLNAAIKNQKFDTCWPSHSVQVFRNATFDSCEIARAKARKAEDTSDLSSMDTEGRPKRKDIRRNCSCCNGYYFAPVYSTRRPKYDAIWRPKWDEIRKPKWDAIRKPKWNAIYINSGTIYLNDV